jgi:vanillate/3-O-methylgallate O-demethylase
MSGMDSQSAFAILPASPLYDDVTLYNMSPLAPRAYEFKGWKPETLSWKNGCYIHAGLSGPSESRFTGPDAEKFLQQLCINSFAKFPIGSGKHVIMLNEEGLVAAHAMLERHGEQDFRFLAGGPYAIYQHSKTDLDVQLEVNNIYIFQVAGPTSLTTLERAAGESLRDIGFLKFRKTRIAGVEVEVCRVGMSGTLAYELRGPIDQGPAVYDTVYQAGQDFGIQRLGWRTYWVNHIEGGFPQLVWTFTGTFDDPGYRDFMARFLGKDPEDLLIRAGSVDPADLRARQRTPVELDWAKFARFDHDFVGREALEEEVADPKRTLVTLVWNKEDVVDIYASLFEEGEEYQTIELPTHPGFSGMLAHADHVLKDGKRIGYSSGCTYSYFYRKMITHGTIDIDQAQIGNEVVIEWGNHGKRIKQVRATVERFPYLDLERNQSYDLSKLPSGVLEA